jgi:hypothetical protein
MLPSGESEAFADIVDRATKRLCGGNLPHFIDAPELWPFSDFPVGSFGHFELVHRALDVARQAYKDDTRATSPKLKEGATTNPNSHANEPSRVNERQEHEALEQRALDVHAAAMAAAKASADATYERDVCELAATLKPKERAAVLLLEDGLSDIEVNRQTKVVYGRGVDRARIARLRKALAEIAERCTLAEIAARKRALLEIRASVALPAADNPHAVDVFTDTPDERRGVGVEAVLNGSRATPVDSDTPTGPCSLSNAALSTGGLAPTRQEMIRGPGQKVLTPERRALDAAESAKYGGSAVTAEQEEQARKAAIRRIIGRRFNPSAATPEEIHAQGLRTLAKMQRQGAQETAKAAQRETDKARWLRLGLRMGHSEASMRQLIADVERAGMLAALDSLLSGTMKPAATDEKKSRGYGA